MKKTLKMVDIARACMQLEKLQEQALPLRISYQLDKLVAKIERPFRFYCEKEMDLLQKYPPDQQDGTSVHFPSQEICDQYNAEHAELDGIEEEIEFMPVRVDINTNLKISQNGLRILMEAGMLEIIGEEAQ